MRSRPGASTTGARWSSTGSRSSPSSALARPPSTTWAATACCGPWERSPTSSCTSSARALSPGAGAGLSPSGRGAGSFASPPSSHATPARRMSSCNARSPSAPSSCTRSAPSQASGLRPSASEPGRTPMQESRDRASRDGRAPLVASLLESARTKGRKMLCASPDHQLVHVQAAVCGPQNRQYQTSGTTCRIRGHGRDLVADHARGGRGHLAAPGDAPDRERLRQRGYRRRDEEPSHEVLDPEGADDALRRADREVGAEAEHDDAPDRQEDLLPRPLGLLALGAAPNERLRDVESIGTEQDPAVHRLEAPPPCGEREHGEERQDRQVRKRLDGHRFPLDPKEVLAQVAPVR